VERGKGFLDGFEGQAMEKLFVFIRGLEAHGSSANLDLNLPAEFHRRDPATQPGDEREAPHSKDAIDPAGVSRRIGVSCVIFWVPSD
jgi:hypothetical protein